MERLPFTQTVVGSVFVAALAGLLVLGIQKLMEVDIGSEEKARQEREAADTARRERQQAEEQARQEREAADAATQTRLQRNPTWRESPSKGTGSSTIRKWKDWRECQEYFNSIGEAKFCYEQGGVVYY